MIYSSKTTETKTITNETTTVTESKTTECKFDLPIKSILTWLASIFLF